MSMLGLYWTITLYIDWQDNPVVTTTTTLAYPIDKVTNKKLIIIKKLLLIKPPTGFDVGFD
jgi:hypothetical protein